MPVRNENADRWGGPGSSHEDRTKSKSDPVVKDPDAPGHPSPRSQVSADERDIERRQAPQPELTEQRDHEAERLERDNRH